MSRSPTASFERPRARARTRRPAVVAGRRPWSATGVAQERACPPDDDHAGRRATSCGTVRRHALDGPAAATILTTAHRLESCRLTVRADLRHGTVTLATAIPPGLVPALEPTTSTRITAVFLQLGERRTTVTALGADGASTKQRPTTQSGHRAGNVRKHPPPARGDGPRGATGPAVDIEDLTVALGPSGPHPSSVGTVEHAAAAPPRQASKTETREVGHSIPTRPPVRRKSIDRDRLSADGHRRPPRRPHAAPQRLGAAVAFPGRLQHLKLPVDLAVLAAIGWTAPIGDDSGNGGRSCCTAY